MTPPSRPPTPEEHRYQRAALDDCRAIAADPSRNATLTARLRTVAVITDGSNVPLLGDVGPLAALPLLERKCRLLRDLAGLKAVPLAMEGSTAEDVVKLISAISPGVGAVNLEAVGDAVSTVIKRRLAELDFMPAYQDRLDGLPVICLAALSSALRVVGKRVGDSRLVVSGGEADSLALINLLRLAGASDVIVCDRLGAIHKGRPGPTNWVKEELAARSNPRQIKGPLPKAAAGADALVVLGPAQGSTRDWLPALAGPRVVLDLGEEPVESLLAADIHASLDPARPNYLGPTLVFPGFLKGVLDARARRLDDSMRVAAAMALAGLAAEEGLGPERIVTRVDRPDLAEVLARAVSTAAAASGAGALP